MKINNLILKSVILVSCLNIFSGKVMAMNLVSNGDFELGNTDFSTDYSFVTNNTTEGEYTVNTNPQDFLPGFDSFGDNTTGNGNMMVVNGSTVANSIVWEQTVTVETNTQYNLSAWFTATVNDRSPAELQFLINSTEIGTPFTVSDVAGLWEISQVSWNSELNTLATISIIDLNTVAGGNDFAIDDIAFNAVPEPLTILGTGTALAFGTFFKRKLGKAKKK